MEHPKLEQLIATVETLRAVFPFVSSHVVSFDNFLTGGVSTNSVYVARL